MSADGGAMIRGNTISPNKCAPGREGAFTEKKPWA